MVRIFILTFLLVTRLLSGQLSVNDPFNLVNTSYDEQNPFISPDGQTLFITIGNHPLNMGGIKDPGDIWLSRWTGNEWSAPMHGGKHINDRSYNGVANISKDGDALFLLSHYDGSGNGAKTQGLSVSHLSKGGWSRPQNIVIPYFKNKSGSVGGYVAGNSSVFVFSAETYGTRGVEDIYVSVKDENGKWSEPKNLGDKINTQFQELCPSLSLDGKTLYFSTNGRKGYGSFDIYYATRLDDSWQNWSEPVNMGVQVNSEGRELFYREINADGSAFYTTTINSDGYGDIKLSQAVKDEEIVNENTTVSRENGPLMITDNDKNRTIINESDAVSIYGKVVNAKSGEPVKARIVFSGPDTNRVVESGEEGYTVAISGAQKYSVTITAPGFISAMEKMDAGTHEIKSLEMNFSLQPVEKGATVNLKSVLFEKSSTRLLEESHPELDMVVSFLKENPDIKIGLSGHTDNKGVHSHNVRLSQERVNRVKEYLVSRGIDTKRITGRGFGGIKPIASNDTEETRRLNRRVEFTITQF